VNDLRGIAEAQVYADAHVIGLIVHGEFSIVQGESLIPDIKGAKSVEMKHRCVVVIAPVPVKCARKSLRISCSSEENPDDCRRKK
jgi:hypothetical protein